MPPHDPYDDPIAAADILIDSGDRAGAREALEELLESDLRCLHAHARLGDMVSRNLYGLNAIRHYEVGVRIGELSSAAERYRLTWPTNAGSKGTALSSTTT